MSRLSEHFTIEEIKCKCGCGEKRVSYKLLKVLERIRNAFQNPMIITSCCRCDEHNEKVGGVKDSLHTCGFACDFHFRDLTVKETAERMRTMHSITWGIGGLGVYYTKGFFHVDLGQHRFWEEI